MATPTWNNSTFDFSEYSSVFSEDQKTYYLGPGYGGQAYDVEYLGLSVADGKLYFGLQSGVNLLSPATSGYLQPGDLAFYIGNDGSWKYGLRFWESNESASLLNAQNGWLDVAYIQHASSNPWRVNNGDSVVAGFKYNKGNDNGRVVVAPVPEPAALILFGSSMILLGGFGRKKLFKKRPHS